MSYEEVGGDVATLVAAPFRSALKWMGWWGSDTWRFARVLPEVSATFAEEGMPIPLFFGRFRLRTPNVAWYGNLVGLESDGPEDYFYTMNVMMVFGIPMGTDKPGGQNPGTIVRRVWWEDSKIWPPGTDDSVVGNWTTGTQPLGRALGEESMPATGTVSFHGGSFDQTVDIYMHSDFDDAEELDHTLLPNYRGLSYAYFYGTVGNQGGFCWGSSTDLPQMSWELEAVTHPLGMSDVNAEGDANPAEVIYDILTNPWGKLGIDTADVDTTAFTAAATTLHTEGHGISLVIDQKTSLQSVIEGILRQIDGVVYVEPSTGKITIKLIREDYEVGSLPAFDKTNIIEVEDYATTLWEGGYNEVRLGFSDRGANYKERQAFAQDSAGILNNKRKTLELSFPGVTTKELANKLAARELQTANLPTVGVKLRVNRDAVELRPGSVIKWSDEDYGITNMVLRVYSFELGEFDDNSIVLICVRDRFDTSHEIFSQPPAVIAPPGEDGPDEVEVWDAIECPRWFNMVSAKPVNEARWCYLAKQPSDATTAFTARRTSVQYQDEYVTDKTGCPFSGYAEVESWHGQYDGTEVDNTYGLYIENLSTGLLATITAATQSQINYNSKNLILVGTEIMAFEDIIDEGGGVYRLKPLWRGVLDTVPVEHDVGERVWFFQAYETVLWNKMGVLTEPIGTPFLLTAELFGTSGTGSEADEGDPQDIALDSRAARPVPPDLFAAGGGYLYTFHQSLLPWSQFPLNETAPLSWRRRKKDKTKIYKPTDADDPETGVTYGLETWTAREGWSEAVSNVDGSTAQIPLERSSYTEAAEKAYARAVATDGDWEAYQAPEIEGDIYMYRNHLINGDFWDGTLREWSTVAGSPSVVSGTRAGTWSSYYVTGTDDYTISQTRWVDAWTPQGMKALAAIYVRSADTSDTATVTIQPLDGDGTPIGSPATSGAVNPYGSTKWRRIEVLFDGLPAYTEKLKVTVAVDINNGGSGDLRIVDCGLYLGDFTTAELLTDPSFEVSGLPDWTEEVGTFFRATNYDFEGTYAAGYNSSSQGTLSQTVLVPSGFDLGYGYVWLHAEGTAAKTDIRVQVRNSGGTPIYQTSILGIGAYESRDAYLFYGAGYDIKVLGYVDGDSDPETTFYLDNFRLRIFKFPLPWDTDFLDFAHPLEQADRFLAADHDWEDYGASKPTAIWLFEDDGTSGQFEDELSHDYSETNLWLDIVSDTNHAYAQTICGFYDVAYGYTTKTGLETREGTNVGADLPNSADASMDGTNDFALLGVFSAKRSTSDRYLAGSGTTVGWNLKLKSDGTLELYVGSSGDSDSITLTGDYRDGALHYFVVWYDHAGTFRLWTGLESPSAVSMPTGDCSNAAPVRLGGVATQTSPASQWAYGVLWRGAGGQALTPAITDSWWVHGKDPTENEVIESHNLNTPVSVPVGYNADGDLIASFSPGQIPIGYVSTGVRGLCCYKAQTNLLSDTDPNSTAWVEEGTPTIVKLYGPDAQRWKRSVYLQSDNVSAYRPPAITQGAGDITVVWYQMFQQEENARLTLKQTDDGNPIHHDYKPATVDVGKWKRFEHTFAWGGGTAAFELWFHGSATATPRITAISAPVLVVTGDEAQLVMTHSTTTLSAIQCVIDENLLSAENLRPNGEVKIRGAMTNDVGSGADEHMVNMHNGNNLGRRIILRDAADNLDLYHYDDSGVLATGTITSPANWDHEFLLRARWNYGGLVEDDSIFAEIDGFGSDNTARAATWTALYTGTYATISIGSNGGANAMNGVLSELYFYAREGTKAL